MREQRGLSDDQREEFRRQEKPEENSVKKNNVAVAEQIAEQIMKIKDSSYQCSENEESRKCAQSHGRQGPQGPETLPY